MRKRNKRSVRPPRQKRSKLLIVVEGSKGKSESLYLEKLGQIVRSKNTALSYKVVSAAGEPRKVYDVACNTIQNKSIEYRGVYLVVDVDAHETLQEVIAECKQKDNPPFYVIVNNPQFEVWLLWHYKDYFKYCTKKQLQDELTKCGLVKENNKKILSNSIPVEKYPDAVARAQKQGVQSTANSIGKNPSSSMPDLIKELVHGSS